MALGRPRGVTGSDLGMSPSDLVAVAYQKVSLGSDTTKAPVMYKKQMSRGKPESALRQNLRVTTHDVKKNRDPAL